MKKEQTYQAFLDGHLVAEYNTSTDVFAEDKCYEALKKRLKNYPSSIDPIDVKIECDGQQIYYEVLVYNFEKENWEMIF